MKIVVVLGTRPEAIKMAPVICYLRHHAHHDVIVVATGQHSSLLKQALDVFGLAPNVTMPSCGRDSVLGYQFARILEQTTQVLSQEQPDLIMAHGDTTSAAGAGLAGFLSRIPIAHVEAGLRTSDLHVPFPEEMNRRVLSQLGTLHFAPTPLARRNLLDCGIHNDQIAVVGNTVVDALRLAPQQCGIEMKPPPSGSDPYILVTLHRRESWDRGIAAVAGALSDVLRARTRMRVVWPVHPNPVVVSQVTSLLGSHARVAIISAQRYDAFLALLKGATLVITDSGGVQEEAVTLGVPVLVARQETERKEGLTGGLEVVGTERTALAASILFRLDFVLMHPMRRHTTLFGDGGAARRIANAIERWRTGLHPLLPSELEFKPEEVDDLYAECAAT